MGGCSFLPPSFGADLPLHLLERCPQDGMLPACKAPRHRPARKACIQLEHLPQSCSVGTKSQKRRRAPRGHRCLCPRLEEIFQPTPDSSQQLSQQTCPAWHLCVPMPHDTSSAVLLYLAKGNEGCPGSCWRGGGLSATDHQGQGWLVDRQAASTGGTVPGLAGKGTGVG